MDGLSNASYLLNFVCCLSAAREVEVESRHVVWKPHIFITAISLFFYQGNWIRKNKYQTDLRINSKSWKIRLFNSARFKKCAQWTLSLCVHLHVISLLQLLSFKYSNRETQPTKSREEQIMLISKQPYFSPPYCLTDQEGQLLLIFTTISRHLGKGK